MKIGDKIQVKAYRSDGQCYRWWSATVTTLKKDLICVITPAGHYVSEINDGWTSKYAIRAFYWFDRPYNLLEVYEPNGELNEIYVHITNLPKIEMSQLHYTDYELDVVLQPGQQPRIVDEDEFIEAAIQYNYPPELQKACYDVAQEAITLVNRWNSKDWL